MAAIEFSKVLELGAQPGLNVAEGGGNVILTIVKDGQRCVLHLDPHEADVIALSIIKGALPAAQRRAQAKQGRPGTSALIQSNGKPAGGGPLP